MPQQSIPLPPPVPDTVEAVGVSSSVLFDIALRYLRSHRNSSLAALRSALKLPYHVIEVLFQQMRDQQLVEIRGTAGHDFLFSLTTGGRNLAAERSETCRYAGPAPVSLAQYSEVVRAQRKSLEPTREGLKQLLADLVVGDDVVDQIGPALISQRPIFFYGPTGCGKTSLVERLPRAFEDSVLVPYAIEVDGQIISVYDPRLHPPLDDGPEPDGDPRWVRCRRPFVIAAGELVPSMLELCLDESTGVYVAPLQFKANNGIFVIDDFGRQAMNPRQLLNRWIMPLDRRIDFLSLRHGYNFQIPFECMVIFSTNIDPWALADEAFLRRIPNKIYVDSVAADEFDEIFRRVCASYGLDAPGETALFLRNLCLELSGSGLRACYPGDVCAVSASMAAYERRPLVLDHPNLERAARLYFPRTQMTSPAVESPGAARSGLDPLDAIGQ